MLPCTVTYSIPSSLKQDSSQWCIFNYTRTEPFSIVSSPIRSICPEHVFLGRERQLKLGYFSDMVHTGIQDIYERLGLLDYMAPEVISIKVRRYCWWCIQWWLDPCLNLAVIFPSKKKYCTDAAQQEQSWKRTPSVVRQRWGFDESRECNHIAKQPLGDANSV